jgi:DNA-binding CsgD family transcriptional regulator
MALRAAGLVERGAQRVALIEEAVAVLDGSPALLERARVQYDLGAAMRAAGYPGAATAVLAQALDGADRCGARLLADAARRELRALGRRPRRAATTGLAALTRTEAEVARLAASGMGNAELASRLSVSPRTVEWHMNSIFRKLGVNRREHLAPFFPENVTS